MSIDETQEAAVPSQSKPPARAVQQLRQMKENLAELQGKLTARGLVITGNDIFAEIVDEIDEIRIERQTLREERDVAVGEAGVLRQSLLEVQEALRDAQERTDATVNEAAQLAIDLATEKARADNIAHDLSDAVVERDRALASSNQLATGYEQPEGEIERLEAELSAVKNQARADLDELLLQKEELYQTHVEIRMAVGWDDLTEGDLVDQVNKIRINRDSLFDQLSVANEDLARSLRQHGEAIKEINRLSEQLHGQEGDLLGKLTVTETRLIKAEDQVRELKEKLQSLSDRTWPNSPFWVKWRCKHHYHHFIVGAGLMSSWDCCWCGKMSVEAPNDRTTYCNREETV